MDPAYGRGPHVFALQNIARTMGRVRDPGGSAARIGAAAGVGAR